MVHQLKHLVVIPVQVLVVEVVQIQVLLKEKMVVMQQLQEDLAVVVVELVVELEQVEMEVAEL